MVQTKRAEINSDTAVSIAHHHRPGSRPQGGFLPSYDPENEGAWDGQLPNPDLVDQLPPPTERKPGGPLDRDEWRRSNAARVGHAAYKLLDVLSGYSNPEGRCWPGMDLLAEVTGMSARALRYALAELRRKELAWPTFPGCTVSRANPYQLAGGLNGWDCARSCTTVVQEVAHRTLSSSNPKINPKDPGAVDAKRLDHVDHPGPETGVTTGVEFFSLEEERTGTGAEPGPQPTPEPSKPTEPTVSAPPPPSDLEEARAFVDAVLPEIPTDSGIESLGKHCWSEWEKHWGGGWAAAWPTWTKDTAGRKKFRSDVVAQLAKVGLPKPPEPNVEDQAARERSSSWMDQRMAEAPKRMVDVKCAGCGFPRQLKPGETHCYPCRKLSEDSTLSRDDQDRQLASQPDRGTWFADDYEKLLEETIRRYQEAHGLAPGDPKVEAVGAALDAG